MKGKPVTKLSDILSLPEYSHFKKVATDDYRDPTIENAWFSLSSKGWSDHRTGGSGPLSSLLQQKVDPVTIYQNATIEDVDRSIIEEYFKNRSITIDDYLVNTLGMKINRHRDKTSIVIPLYSPTKILCRLVHIELDQHYNKIIKKFFGRSMHDCGSLLLKGSTKLIITEGIENAIVLYQNTEGYDVLSVGHAASFKRALKFTEKYESSIVILDNDADNASLRHSFHLSDKFQRYVPAEVGVDANDALEQGWFKQWYASLMENPVPYTDVVKAYEKSAHSRENAIITELNKTHAIIKIQGKVVVLNDEFDEMFNRQAITLSSKTDFLLWHSNRWVQIENPVTEELKRVNVGTYWLNSTFRRQYTGFKMDTAINGTNIDDKMFNLWRGFSVDAKKGDCSLFYDHLLHNGSRGNQEIYDYLLNWMAWSIQNPGDPPGVAVVFRGQQGTGKGTIISLFGKLFGHHMLHISNSKHITGNFNGHLKDCLFLFADEAFFAGDSKHESILKTLITEKVTVIEFKGKEAFQFPNRIKVMMSSNKSWVAPLDFDDRRFFITDIGIRNRQDTVYFKAIYNQMEKGGFAALLHDLKNRDLSGFDISKYPRTNAILENKFRSLNSVASFVLDQLVLEKIPNQLNIQEFYQLYVDGCGRVYPEKLNGFARELRRIYPELIAVKTGNGSRFYKFGVADLEEARLVFETHFGQSVRWGDL